MYGADIMMPVLDMGLFGLTLYGDLAFQQKDETPVKAYRTGLMGDIVGFIRYRADVTFPESGYQRTTSQRSMTSTAINPMRTASQSITSTCSPISGSTCSMRTSSLM